MRRTISERINLYSDETPVLPLVQGDTTTLILRLYLNNSVPFNPDGVILNVVREDEQKIMQNINIAISGNIIIIALFPEIVEISGRISLELKFAENNELISSHIFSANVAPTLINGQTTAPPASDISKALIMSVRSPYIDDVTKTWWVYDNETGTFIDTGIKPTGGLDGISIDYNWSGTSLGIKREDEANYVYADLKGESGEQGIQGVQGIKGDKGDSGKDGTGIAIKGSYNSYAELLSDHPVGIAGDSYLINGDLYVWSDNTNDWINAGSIKGEKGDPAVVVDASTTQKGVVQLNDTLTSTSTTEALTANQGKTLNDKLENAIGDIEAVLDAVLGEVI